MLADLLIRAQAITITSDHLALAMLQFCLSSCVLGQMSGLAGDWRETAIEERGASLAVLAARYRWADWRPGSTD